MGMKRPVEDQVVEMVMGEREILRDYRLAENKNKQVRILADLNCCTPRMMAQFLAAHGEKVDGRLLNSGGSRKAADTHTHTAPAAGDGAAGPADEPSRAEPSAPEPRVPPVTKTSGQSLPASPCSPAETESGPADEARSMTAGVLAALLAKIDPEAVVRLDGEGVASWLHVSVCYEANGERSDTEVCIHPAE